MSKRPPKEKRPQNARATTVAKLRRMGAFNGGGTVEERLRAELAARDFGVAYLLPFARTGRKVRAPFDEHNAERKRNAETKHSKWQVRADELWAKNSRLSKDDVAKLIATEENNPWQPQVDALSAQNPNLPKQRLKKLLAEQGIELVSAGTIRNNLRKPEK